MPELIQRIVSNNDSPLFFEGNVRILSLTEILHASSDLHVDFISQGILPLADRGDNDFVVYLFREKKWSLFNITDELLFKQRGHLEELL